ncbi:hypothetical protein [Fibrella aquatilis]|uniref:Uncharacterized protein n=1 Tax=Fibrella aquatilis TaxID=2817059 RepID=A0A939G1M2_9BACT|nr:hypothetical protein [Fibrella aquatilis]MBO0930349.1 hypothetical protein [Fibrella aquatilis]
MSQSVSSIHAPGRGTAVAAQNTDLSEAIMVSIPVAQLDRLKAAYAQMLTEKVQMERDVSVLMTTGRRLMALFQGKNILKTASQVMRHPEKHKAEFAELEALYLKYQHLMPADGH